MIFEDYRVLCTVQQQGGGTGFRFSGLAEGPYPNKLDAFVAGVLAALRRAPPPGAVGLYVQRYGMAPYPLKDWVQIQAEAVRL